MAVYGIIFCALLTTALVGDISRRWMKPLLLAELVALALFAGLRYETGYDWPVYVRAFELTPLLSDLLPVDYITEELSLMEPSFIFVMSFVKTLGGGFVALCFFVALFNILCLYIFLRSVRGNGLWIVFVYYACLFLVVQMAVLRQSIALSFLMLAIVFASRDSSREAHRGNIVLFIDRLKSALLLIIAAMFQYSTIMFFPLFIRSARKFLIKNFGLCIIALLPFLFFNVTGVLSEVLERFGDGFIANKINAYLDNFEYERSASVFAYLVFNVAVSLFLRDRTKTDNSRLSEILLASSMLLAIFQILFSHIPVFWNRFQYFGLLAQAMLLCSNWNDISRDRRVIEKIGAIGFCGALFFSFTLSTSFLPYKPYQFYPLYEFYNIRSTGADRTETFLSHMEDANN